MMRFFNFFRKRKQSKSNELLSLLLIIMPIMGCSSKHDSSQAKSPNEKDEKVASKINSTQPISEIPWFINEGDRYLWKHEKNEDVVEIKILKIDSNIVRLSVKRPKYIKDSPLPPPRKIIGEEVLEVDRSELPFVITNVDKPWNKVSWEWMPSKGLWKANTNTYENSYFVRITISPKQDRKVPDIGYQYVYVNSSNSYLWRPRWYRSL